MAEQFEAAMAAYGFDGPGVTLGAASHGGAAVPAVQVRVPLAMFNRHGLVAGATGTGKTKSLQVLAEQLSDAGVPVFISDIKGDISGLAAAAALNDKITARAATVGDAEYAPRGFPVEFYTLDRGGTGVRLRASVHSFGPILLAKVMSLNETQQSVLALAFKYADDHQLPLIDLSDLRALLNHLDSDEGKSAMEEYGGVATATIGVMVRKIVELEQQEADAFFGAPEFEVLDLLRQTADGKGIVNIVELSDMQDRPALFSTFLMWLLANLYERLPEVGDLDRPKLVFFFDEAHLLFRDANKSFLRQIELVARLIRSKGVGVFLVTHTPSDVPDFVLSQLGNRIQHALRAYTPDDLQLVRATAQTFPMTDLYEVATELTGVGIGEAMASPLSPKGAPMPTAHVIMRAPRSLMAQVDPSLMTAIANGSALATRYATDVDPVSAKELLAQRLAVAQGSAAQAAPDPATAGTATRTTSAPGRMRSTKPPQAGAAWADVVQEGSRFVRSSTFNTLLRGVFGVLNKK
jgi:DNA double-strand break repair helicase HerA and related ATPase